LYEDYGGKQKVMIDLACAGHSAMWDKAHSALFKASLEWLEKGTVNDMQSGVIKVGY